MLTAINAVFWCPEPDRVSSNIQRAFAERVSTGKAAATTTGVTATSTLACHTFPSNKPGQPAPRATGMYQDASVHVVCAAHLTNRKPLEKQLGLPAGSDPAVLIAALYARDGIAGLDQLAGAFALVLHDLATDTVIARRDPFGVCPLFWAWGAGGQLAFASLPEVLIDAGVIKAKRNLDGVVDLIASSSAAKPRTLITGLYRVPANSQMTFSASDAGRVPAAKTCWRPSPAPDAPKDFDGWSRELRRLMDRAVATRIPTTGDLAASVSSGLDSTSVTMLAEAHLSDDQHIFASTYAASEEAEQTYSGLLDETEVAQQVVAGSNRISWRRHRLKPKIDHKPAELGVIAWQFDEGVPEYETAIAAAQSGADVLLTGWGGDNAASYKGLGTHAALLKKGNLRQLRLLADARKLRGRKRLKFYARAAADTLMPQGTRLRELFSGPKRETMNYNHRMYTGFKPQYRANSDLLEFRTSDTQTNRLS
ncbi:asparagine synthase-related protein [Shimia ponticola]|uniref:asparagine synthase-related protein n=1 Tax=Shimia ponticola TaxID=2582893 RepID=UPI0011BF8DAE|nr:asparagine synthase-related protein [Shimia ponticola]